MFSKKESIQLNQTTSHKNQKQVENNIHLKTTKRGLDDDDLNFPTTGDLNKTGGEMPSK